METLNGFVTVINDFLWTYILVIALIVLGLYFSFRTKFVQFRYFGEMFRLLGDGMGKEAKADGKISSFQAFCISTASRVGTGNIAGVATAPPAPLIKPSDVAVIRYLEYQAAPSEPISP